MTRYFLVLIVLFTSALNASEKSAEIVCENSEMKLQLNLEKDSRIIDGHEYYNPYNGEFSSYVNLYCTFNHKDEKSDTLDCEGEFGDIWSIYVIPKNVFSLKRNHSIPVMEHKRDYKGEIYQEKSIVGCILR